MPVILVTLEAKIGKIKVWGQAGQTVQDTPPQPIKTGYSGMHLSSQLHRKHKLSDSNPGQPRNKSKNLLAQMVECLPAQGPEFKTQYCKREKNPRTGNVAQW
jgi:hypothetical protein